MMRVLIVGLGHMGQSHALAHHAAAGVEIIGLVNRTARSLPEEMEDYPLIPTFSEGLALRPDLVVIATDPENHAEFAERALRSGANVFVETPLATSVADAQRVVSVAQQTGRKLVVGYTLRHHPDWMRLIEEARELGGPYVFRMSAAQHSSGKAWAKHQAVMETTSPVVACGGQYVDVWCQITDAKPVAVQGMGARLSDEIAPDMYNYAQFQVFFEDGSVGCCDAGWGPMMSETAGVAKDVISPRGAVSVTEVTTSDRAGGAWPMSEGGVFVHRPGTDSLITGDEGPDHQALCDVEQAFVRQAITEDLDLSGSMQDAVRSLAICLAADKAIRTGTRIAL